MKIEIECITEAEMVEYINDLQPCTCGAKKIKVIETTQNTWTFLKENGKIDCIADGVDENGKVDETTVTFVCAECGTELNE